MVLRSSFSMIISSNTTISLFPHLQMFYVPLTTKGKFYEVAVNSNQSSNSQTSRHNSSGGGHNNLGQNPHHHSHQHHFDVARKADYVYRISDLVLNNSSLPLNLKLVYAPSFVDLPGRGPAHFFCPSKVIYLSQWPFNIHSLFSLPSRTHTMQTT